MAGQVRQANGHCAHGFTMGGNPPCFIQLRRSKGKFVTGLLRCTIDAQLVNVAR